MSKVEQRMTIDLHIRANIGCFNLHLPDGDRSFGRGAFLFVGVWGICQVTNIHALKAPLTIMVDEDEQIDKFGLYRFSIGLAAE